MFGMDPRRQAKSKPPYQRLMFDATPPALQGYEEARVADSAAYRAIRDRVLQVARGFLPGPEGVPTGVPTDNGHAQDRHVVRVLRNLLRRGSITIQKFGDPVECYRGFKEFTVRGLEPKAALLWTKALLIQRPIYPMGSDWIESILSARGLEDIATALDLYRAQHPSVERSHTFKEGRLSFYLPLSRVCTSKVDRCNRISSTENTISFTCSMPFGCDDLLIPQVLARPTVWILERAQKASGG